MQNAWRPCGCHAFYLNLKYSWKTFHKRRRRGMILGLLSAAFCGGKFVTLFWGKVFFFRYAWLSYNGGDFVEEFLGLCCGDWEF